MNYTKLYKNWWMHNLVGHPLMQIFGLVSNDAADWVHDVTLPVKTSKQSQLHSPFNQEKKHMISALDVQIENSSVVVLIRQEDVSVLEQLLTFKSPQEAIDNLPIGCMNERIIIRPM